MMHYDGNCLCRVNTLCPCDEFLDNDKCECGVYQAGELIPIQEEIDEVCPICKKRHAHTKRFGTVLLTKTKRPSFDMP